MGAPVVIGAIGGPFGVQGWMHVRSFTEPAENILAYRPWQLRRQTSWQPVVARARAHRRGFVACFEGVAERDAAERLRGLPIGVDADVLPTADEGEYYWRDLTGLSVATLAGDELGVVERLFSTPAHDVLVVVGVGDDEVDREGREGSGSRGSGKGRKERLLPFVRDVVTQVDMRSRRIVVDWQADWF